MHEFKHRYFSRTELPEFATDPYLRREVKSNDLYARTFGVFKSAPGENVYCMLLKVLGTEVLDYLIKNMEQDFLKVVDIVLWDHLHDTQGDPKDLQFNLIVTSLWYSMKLERSKLSVRQRVLADFLKTVKLPKPFKDLLANHFSYEGGFTLNHIYIRRFEPSELAA